MKTPVSRNLLLIFCVILLCAGCDRVPSLEGLVPAEGVVTLNGEPVGKACLLLRPIEQGQSATATTDDNGRFSLMTFNPDDGAKPGEYLVTVTKTETRGDIRIERPNGTNQKIVHDDREIIDHLPEKYAAFSTTDLQITIPKNGDTKLEISLTGEVETTPKKIKDLKRRM